MEIEIRDALEADAEALSPLMEQLMHEPSTPDQIARGCAVLPIPAQIEPCGRGRWACRRSGRFALAWMVHADAPTARVMSIVVDEACRGHGIGRRLVEASVGQARAWGCDRIELTSRLERSGAHSFYETVVSSIPRNASRCRSSSGGGPSLGPSELGHESRHRRIARLDDLQQVG